MADRHESTSLGGTALPPYTVRKSGRAKRVTLRVSPRVGLEVVVPSSFDVSRVPEIVAARAQWASKHLRKLYEQGFDPSAAQSLPEVLELRAIGQRFELRAVHAEGKPWSLRQQGPSRLVLVGNLDDHEGGRKAVFAWLRDRARQHFVPMLRELSEQHNLPFDRCRFRAQKSRWGSCSARGTISLNCKLSFLPPELARHVLLHELAHVRHLNHSAQFWALLTKLDPQTAQNDKALGDAWKYVPAWLGF